MNDPRDVSETQRQSSLLQKSKSHLSPLMQELTKPDRGDKVIWCPYGCAQPDCDENGYCRHLVGFTDDGKSMEPMVLKEDGRRFVDGRKAQPVKKTDKLIKITVSSRVYRDVDEEAKQAAEAALEEATRPAAAKV